MEDISKMTREQIIDRLRNDGDYYGEFGKNFMSKSSIGALLLDPKSFMDEQEDSKQLLVGRYFHALMLEPEKVKDFKVVDCSTRTTKEYKAAEAENGGAMILLLKETEEAKKWASAMKGNIAFCDEIYAPGNTFEEPEICEMFGLWFKGKADVLTPKGNKVNIATRFVYDLKTTADITQFKWSAKKYHYDVQAFIYQELFHATMVFLCVDKETGLLGRFLPTEEFIASGRDKCERGMGVYERFYGNNATDDANDYFIEEYLM